MHEQGHLFVMFIYALPAYSIKDMARYVTELSNNQDGLARFVDDFVL